MNTTTPPARKPLTVNRAAAVLGVSGPFLRRLCNAGEIEHLAFKGVVRIPAESLDRFISKHTKGRSADA